MCYFFEDWNKTKTGRKSEQKTATVNDAKAYSKITIE